MIRISKLADYAIVIMNNIAASSTDLPSAKEIASAVRLAEPTVSKLLKTLTKHQLLLSKRGVNGGYELAKPAAEITIADIIEAIDGEIVLTGCDNKTEHCSIVSSCTVSHNWRRISTKIRDALRQISLEEMQHEIPEHTIQFDFKKRASQ